MLNYGRPQTFLSLTRYAQMIGLDPIQFFSGVTDLRGVNSCSDIWYENSWQDGGKVSRLELLNAIAQAENEIINAIGYFPYPEWVVDERLDYTKSLYPERYGYTGRDSRGQNKSVLTKRKYVISGGQRATTALTDFSRLADIDTTGDTFDDTAVFQINNYTNEPCEIQAFIKVYDAADATNTRTDPSSTGADRAWRIRPIHIKYDSATDIALVYIKTYLLFKPQLQQQITLGSNDNQNIDADAAASYVDTVEFYRVYNDPSQMVQFLWVNELSCSSSACAWATQDGCMRVKNSRQGEVSLQPATYSSGAYTGVSCFSQGIEPQKARLWYYAGLRDKWGNDCGEMPYDLAYSIALLASARLHKEICHCDNIRDLVNDWRQNAAKSNSDRSYTFDVADLRNPFGTKVGEILAWNRIKNYSVRVARAALG